VTLHAINDVPLQPATAAEKQRLLESALAELRKAHALDEREAADFTPAWYDATIQTAVSIKQLAGVIEIELTRRRGLLIAAEGEQRGGDRKSAIKVEHQSTLISQAERDERKKARAIADNPEAVERYVQETVAQGRTPTKTGALHAVKNTTAVLGSPKSSTSPQTLDVDALTDTLVAERLRGIPVRDIAQHYGLSIGTVQKRLRQGGLGASDKRKVSVVMSVLDRVEDMPRGLRDVTVLLEQPFIVASLRRELPPDVWQEWRKSVVAAIGALRRFLGPLDDFIGRLNDHELPPDGRRVLGSRAPSPAGS
jgi:hypothetical protein